MKRYIPNRLDILVHVKYIHRKDDSLVLFNVKNYVMNGPGIDYICYYYRDDSEAERGQFYRPQ